MKELYVLIDWQNDFADKNGALYVPNEIDRNLVYFYVNKALRLNKNSVGLVTTYDTHFKDNYNRLNESTLFPIHCEKNTWGWQLADTKEKYIEKTMLDSDRSVFTLEKHVFNMWEQNNLRIRDSKMLFDMVDRDMFFYFLREHAGVETVHIAGLAADYCVKQAIEGFVERRFNVVVHKNLTAHIETPIQEVVKNMKNVRLV